MLHTRGRGDYTLFFIANIQTDDREMLAQQTATVLLLLASSATALPEIVKLGKGRGGRIFRERILIRKNMFGQVRRERIVPFADSVVCCLNLNLNIPLSCPDSSV